MCSEAVWWRGHRRIVADYLLLRGRSVLHLMGSNRAELAKMNEGARRKGEELVYPAAESRSRPPRAHLRSEEHTSELQSLMRISYAVFCLKKKKHENKNNKTAKTRNTKNRTN